MTKDIPYIDIINTDAESTKKISDMKRRIINEDLGK